MARLYSDEDFWFPVVEELRKTGHDILTAEESCMRSSRAGMEWIEYHRVLSGMSDGEVAIVGSAAAGAHAL